jgi:hypothetical protein
MGMGSSHPLGDGGDGIGMENFFGDKDGDGKFGRGSNVAIKF